MEAWRFQHMLVIPSRADHEGPPSRTASHSREITPDPNAALNVSRKRFTHSEVPRRLRDSG